MVLTTQLTSCQSKPEPQYVVRTVYDVPPLKFPDFPALKDSICIPLDAENKLCKNDKEVVNVIIPYWYLQLLARFKLDYESLQRVYKYYESVEQDYSGAVSNP